MEGNDTEALGFPCGAKKNPLALVLAEVEAYGTPLWPQKNYPLTPLGHFSHVQFLWEGLVAKPTKRCNLCDKCMEMPLPLSSRVA